MEDMATGEIRLSILWEWVHKDARLTAADEAAGVREGDAFTLELCLRLVAEEFAKLQRASNRDVHDDSKATTLPDRARDRRDVCRSAAQAALVRRSAEHHAGRPGPGDSAEAHRAATSERLRPTARGSRRIWISREGRLPGSAHWPPTCPCLTALGPCYDDLFARTWRQVPAGALIQSARHTAVPHPLGRASRRSSVGRAADS